MTYTFLPFQFTPPLPFQFAPPLPANKHSPYCSLAILFFPATNNGPVNSSLPPFFQLCSHQATSVSAMEKGERVVRGAAGETLLLFFGQNSCWSNFFPAKISIVLPCWVPGVGQRVEFATAEAMYAGLKACFFRDRASLRRILDASSPSEAKKLGREVRGFSAKAWNKTSVSAMRLVLALKFQQNPNCAMALLSLSHDTILVESCADRRWGNGVPLWSPDAGDTSRWTGRNLLGLLLNQQRQHLSLLLSFKGPSPTNSLSHNHFFLLLPTSARNEFEAWGSWRGRTLKDGSLKEGLDF